MPNPYASTGSVSTVAANVSGNNNLNDFRDPSGKSPSGSAKPVSAAAVTRRLFTYLRPHVAMLALSFVSAALSIVLQLYVPILIGQGIDLMLGAGAVDLDALLPLLAKLATVVVFASALQWVQGYCVNRLSYKTVRDLRIEASDKLTRVPLATIDGHAHGDLISRVTNDVDQVGDGLLQGLTQLFAGVVTIAGTLAFMLVTSVPMALVVVLVTPLSVLAAAGIAKFSNKSFTAQMRIQGQLSGYIEEYVGAQKLVEAFAHGERACEGFAAINRELYTAGERAQFLSSLSNPGTRFINNLIYGLVAAVGCLGVITGVPAALTVGQVQIFLSYANQYTKPFNEISGVVTQIQAAYASARRVFSLLDAPEDEPDAPGALELVEREDCKSKTGERELFQLNEGEKGPKLLGNLPLEAMGLESLPLDAPEAAMGLGSLPLGDGAVLARSASTGSLRGDVVFDHVDFSYTPDRKLLQDICIHAKPGMRMALVGPTGCGKTTLINLLLRFYDVDAGEIRIDGHPMKNCTRESLRRAFGMVLQESWLFEGTVHDNIAYSCPGATRVQVEKAARRARAHKFICTLPQGYDTVLPEDGGSLSQGQRQLLCIARVMLADPAILLLDEATSSIDTRTELQVQAAFDELMRGRTSFVVAHRLSTIREADCILVMKDGRLIESGTHEELLERRGFYADLYNSQFAPSA